MSRRLRYSEIWLKIANLNLPFYIILITVLYFIRPSIVPVTVQPLATRVFY